MKKPLEIEQRESVSPAAICRTEDTVSASAETQSVFLADGCSVSIG